MDTVVDAQVRFRELQSRFNQTQRMAAELRRRGELIHHDSQRLQAHSNDLLAKVQRALAHRPSPAGQPPPAGH